MREILFRGKRADNEQWVEGMLDGGNGRYMINCRTYSVYSNGYWVYEVEPETVGQYTGLTDRNGKKIFEGDIVNAFLVDCNEMGVIKFNDLMCRFMYFCKDGCWGIDHTDRIEVIGNIHDNPELLNEK